MAKITELSDGGSLQSTDYLIAVRSGGNVKVQADGNLSLGTVTTTGSVGIGTASPIAQLQIGDYTGASEQIAIGSATTGTGDLLFGDGSTGNLSYRGVVRYDHTDDSMQLWTSSAEKVRIDSSGNVGIGEPNPVQKLHISGASGSARMSLERTSTNTTGGVGSLQWNALDGHAVAGIIAYGDGDDEGASLVFNTTSAASSSDVYVSTTERMRVDASGNVIFGTTGQAYINGAAPNTYNSGYDQDSDSWATWINYSGYQGGTTRYRDLIVGDGKNARVATFDGSSGNLLVGKTTPNVGTAGVEFRAGSSNYMVTSGDTVLGLNRLTSDGTIQEFRKDTTVVGSIGVESGDNLYIDCNTADHAGLLFWSGASSSEGRITPRFNGTSSDAAVDLGRSENRFKDLYLSGGMKLARDVSLETEIETYNNTNSGGAKYKISFRQNGTQVGVIEVGTSATNYVTSSDYRLKENVVAMSGATERLKQLAPKRFNFITTPDTTVDGFLAHEVQDIVPEAITGTKDAVDAEGNPEYQGIDQSKLVPLLVATIQELEARIAALEGAN